MRIFHTLNVHGKTERHKKAKSSWMPLYEDGVIGVWIDEFPRTAKTIGDTRDLPYLKDVLAIGMAIATQSDDIIMWSNDDVILDPRIEQWCLDEVSANDAMSMRRFEPENPEMIHLGRELLAFKKEWLEKNWNDIPDFILGCPCFDIVMAAFIRKQKGLKSTLANMSEDYPLCEATERYAIHHAHPSAWAGKDEYKRIGNIHNKQLAKEWCHKNMPTLHL